MNDIGLRRKETQARFSGDFIVSAHNKMDIAHQLEENKYVIIGDALIVGRHAIPISHIRNISAHDTIFITLRDDSIGYIKTQIPSSELITLSKELWGKSDIIGHEIHQLKAELAKLKSEIDKLRPVGI